MCERGQLVAFARLLVDLHHLLGWACQLAHPLGKFQEAYRNLTRNLSSSINLLVSPCLLPEPSPAHSPPQPRSAAAPHQLCCLPEPFLGLAQLWTVTFYHPTWGFFVIYREMLYF